MEKEFIPYEQALALKEFGFDEECLDFYDDSKELFYCSENKDKIHIGEGVKSPLYQQAFRWFREKHGIFSSIWRFETEQKFFIEFGFGIQKFQVNNKEKAELECLEKLIEIVKNNEKSSLHNNRR